MDLMAVRAMLDRGDYSGVGDFAKDVRKILENKIVYNAGSNQAALFVAKGLRNLFEMGMERRFIESGAWKQILAELISVKEAHYFREPVDPVKLGILHYSRVITEPMDLGAVQTKLRAGRYESAQAFSSDMRLVFRNAMTFNHAATGVYDFAKKLKKRFEERMRYLVAPAPNDKSTDIGSESMASILDRLQAEPDAVYFAEPVKVFRRILASLTADSSFLYLRTPPEPVSMGIPEYPILITQHIDFSSIVARIDASAVTGLDALQADLNLVIANITAFNQNPSHAIHVAALSFRARVAITLDTQHLRLPSPPRYATTALQANTSQTSQKTLTGVLKSLLHDPSAKAYFLVPVDPVALGIPDYETVVTRSMDLGTVATRLKLGRYKGAVDFAADVHLVFSNAMLYNANPNHTARRSVSLMLTRDRDWVC
jgi:hypothetical protein